MKNLIIADILISMKAAVDNIQTDVKEKGFIGDINDAEAVKTFCANHDFGSFDYAMLHANSAVIREGDRLVTKFGTKSDKKKAAKWAVFDYSYE